MYSTNRNNNKSPNLKSNNFQFDTVSIGTVSSIRSHNSTNQISVVNNQQTKRSIKLTFKMFREMHQELITDIPSKLLLKPNDMKILLIFNRFLSIVEGVNTRYQLIQCQEAIYVVKNFNQNGLQNFSSTKDSNPNSSRQMKDERRQSDRLKENQILIMIINNLKREHGVHIMLRPLDRILNQNSWFFMNYLKNQLGLSIQFQTLVIIPSKRNSLNIQQHQRPEQNNQENLAVQFSGAIWINYFLRHKYQQNACAFLIQMQYANTFEDIQLIAYQNLDILVENAIQQILPPSKQINILENVPDIIIPNLFDMNGAQLLSPIRALPFCGTPLFNKIHNWSPRLTNLDYQNRQTKQTNQGIIERLNSFDTENEGVVDEQQTKPYLFGSEPFFNTHKLVQVTEILEINSCPVNKKTEANNNQLTPSRIRTHLPSESKILSAVKGRTLSNQFSPRPFNTVLTQSKETSKEADRPQKIQQTKIILTIIIFIGLLVAYFVC